jgi:4-amino-4-deoxy-L-arabinose transferase-like glycosyltransferase
LPILAIVGLAVVLRLSAVIAWPAKPISDAAEYHGLAARLTQGLGFVGVEGVPTAFRAPLYPAFVAGAYALAGVDPQNAAVAQAILGGITVALLLLLGCMTVGYREGVAAGILAAIYPGFACLSRVVLSENLVLPLLLASLCGAAMLMETRRISWAVVIGICLGLAALTRLSALFVLPPLCIGLLISIRREGHRRWALGLTAVILVTFGACLAPWAIRNSRALGQGPLLSTSGGITLYASYWPPSVEGKRIWGNVPGPEDPAVAQAMRGRNEVEASRELTRLTLQSLAADPLHFFALLPVKMMWLLAPFDWDWLPRQAGTTRSLNLGYLCLLLPGAAGFIYVLSHPHRHEWLLWVIPIGVVVQAVIFYGGPRFRLPAETTLVILAAVGLVRTRVRPARAGVPRSGRRGYANIEGHGQVNRR